MPAGVAPARLSGLNRDGTPRQLCFSSSPRGVRARLIGEPALHVDDPAERVRRVRRAAREVLAMTGSTALEPLAERVLATFGPRDDREAREYPDGLLWLAASLRGSGAALYVDARRGGERAAWDRARAWFTDATPSADARDAIDALRRHATLLCVALEGSTPADARIKLYWRLPEIVALGALGVPLFGDPAFARFAALAIGGRAMRVTGVVMSLGFAVDGGRLTDAKLDLCACEHCLARPRDEWDALLGRVAEEFGVVAFDGAARAAGRASFLGLGLDAAGGARLNYYVNPAAAA